MKHFRISIALCLLAPMMAFAAAPPTALRCESLRDPQGIDRTTPNLSWEMQSSARGERQSAYEILAASSAENLSADRGDLWDSGRILSDQSVEVPYGGAGLSSGRRVFWKVRVWDKDQQASPWSESAVWSMGLLSPGDWTAQWIGKDEKPVATQATTKSSDVNGPHPELRRLPARWLRKEFDVAKPVRRATVYFSGLGLSELYLNGEKVGDAVLSPALSDYTKRDFYVTYDLTGSLHTGRNAMGVVLGNGRFWAPRSGSTVSYGYPKLLLEMRIDYTDGTAATVTSDGSWKLSTDGPILANNEYDGEEYDARKEFRGWAKAGFDDSSWAVASVVKAPGGKMSAPMIDPIRVTGVVSPIALNQPKPGVSIFDMGQNFVGWCKLRVTGPAGTTVQLRFAERLLPDGTLDVANLRGAKVTDKYTLRGGGEEIWEPRFTYHGFRYVELSGFPGTPTLDSLQGRIVNDDLESAGDFTCSQPTINQIYHNIVWGVRGNYRSIPTDCPQRDERQGWMGDRACECKGESYLFGIGALYAKWVADMADSQLDNGSISDVCPAYWRLYHDNVVWPSAFVIAPGMLLNQYGDTHTIATFYPQMVKWIDHMSTFIKDDILPRDNYGDWCVPPEDPALIHSKDPARQTAGPILGTTYFYYCLNRMSDYARLLNKPDDAARFDALAQRLKNGLNKTYLNTKLGQYDNGAQTTSVLPLAFGMVPDDQKKAVFDHLVDQITNVTHMHIGTGLVGGQWLNRVLSDFGRPDIAYSLATERTYPSWGYMADHGATTIWELWNGNTADPAMNSGNHVMLVGDLGIWMYENLAGIASDARVPGFKHIIMKPTIVGDLKFVKASHHGPYGVISSQWQRDGNRFTWNIVVPPNSSATIYIPAKSVDSVSEGGRAIDASSGIKFVEAKNSLAVFEIGSGTYRFDSSF